MVTKTGAAAQHTWRNIRLIVGREYKSHVTQRSFIISSVILLVLVALAAFIPTITQFISLRVNVQTDIVLVNNAGIVAGWDEAALVSYIDAGLNGTNHTGPVPYLITSQPPAELETQVNQVKTGKRNVLLELARAANGDLQLTYYTRANTTQDGNLPKIQALAQQLSFLDAARRLNITPSEISRLLTPPNLAVVRTQTTRPANQLVAGYVLAFAGATLMYLAVALYAASVAAGVAEEKGSRVMEILVNATTPFQLLVGKIVGIGAACLTQMAAIVVVGIGALTLQIPLQAVLFGENGGGFIRYLTGVSIPFYLFFLVYFLLDFFMYATLYAGLGALVKRQDEVQSAVMVPGLLVMLGFWSVYLGAAAPDATYVKVLSYIPIFTPTLMLVRLGLSTVAWWEFALTIGVMLVTITVGALISVRLYRYGVLMYGQRPTLRQMVRLIRTK